MFKNRPLRTRYSQRYDAWEGSSDPRKFALSTHQGVFYSLVSLTVSVKTMYCYCFFVLYRRSDECESAI